MNDGTHDDDWCRANTSPPALSMQGHSAPLGITFYNAKKDIDPSCTSDNDNIGGGFPASMDGDAFVAFHGSWNRNIPTGYKVVRIPMKNGLPSVEEPLDFFCHGGNNAKWSSGLRPVDVKFDTCNRLLVSSDGTNGRGDGVIIIGYKGAKKEGNRGDEFNVSGSQNSTECIQCGMSSSGSNLELNKTLSITIPLVVLAISFMGLGAYLWRKKKMSLSAKQENPVDVEEISGDVEEVSGLET
uniref:Pyrroloquinoline quinone-dependent pyranose dehydrogenase beta-propeller domain-containing protein n=1 Tax=Corethron hystrix TaxID=216773 RepID=A0A7S1FWQ0_9STRA|mmetsp:Transcript_36613/g.85584  ORF Transcript_36613/g.85584 Transcript_36613/m.85584 type:complete len:241 (+) Transcript_36613:737-1459(+)